MTSLNLLSLIFLSPIKLIEEILVRLPLSISIKISKLLLSISFAFTSTLLLLYPKVE